LELWTVRGAERNGTYLYAAWITASFPVENAVFASTRVAVHDGDNHVALEVLEAGQRVRCGVESWVKSRKVG
jgi:hypothetical protein